MPKVSSRYPRLAQIMKVPAAYHVPVDFYNECFDKEYRNALFVAWYRSVTHPDFIDEKLCASDYIPSRMEMKPIVDKLTLLAEDQYVRFEPYRFVPMERSNLKGHRISGYRAALFALERKHRPNSLRLKNYGYVPTENEVKSLHEIHAHLLPESFLVKEGEEPLPFKWDTLDDGFEYLNENCYTSGQFEAASDDEDCFLTLDLHGEEELALAEEEECRAEASSCKLEWFSGRYSDNDKDDIEMIVIPDEEGETAVEDDKDEEEEDQETIDAGLYKWLFEQGLDAHRIPLARIVECPNELFGPIKDMLKPVVTLTFREVVSRAKNGSPDNKVVRNFQAFLAAYVCRQTSY